MAQYGYVDPAVKGSEEPLTLTFHHEWYQSGPRVDGHAPIAEGYTLTLKRRISVNPSRYETARFRLEVDKETLQDCFAPHARGGNAVNEQTAINRLTLTKETSAIGKT